MLKRTVDELYKGTPGEQVLAAFRQERKTPTSFVNGVYEVRRQVLDKLAPVSCPELEAFREYPSVCSFLDSTTRRGQVKALAQMPAEVRALVTEEVEPSNLVPFSVTPDEVTAKKAADAQALQRKTDTAVTIEGVGDMIRKATDVLATDHACRCGWGCAC